MNEVQSELNAMGVDDVSFIGVGKDEYNSDLAGMINSNTIPWVEDKESEEYPVWLDYEAVQRSTYFLDRNGDLIYQFNITTLDPNNSDDFFYLINLILDYRSEDGPNVVRVTSENPSIQSAIDIVDDGDIILVDPGVYIGQINFLDKNFTLASLIYNGLNGEDSERSILDGNGLGSVVTINGGQDQSTILLGFVIKNGNSTDYGGGILIEDSSPTIDRNVIHHNQAGSCGGYGGGIAIMGDSYPYIFANEIYDNSVSGECDCDCYFGGGIYVDIDSWPVIGGSMTLGNVLFDNQADTGNQLYRDYGSDTISWTPIYAHHNYFNICPPGINEVYPPSGWDLDNCHLIAELGVQELMPKDEISLLQNYPNPFNFSTNITIVLNSEKLVDIVIYDVGGRVVFSKKYKLNSGKNIVQWNALGQPSGLYLISAIANNYSMTRKAIFVK